MRFLLFLFGIFVSQGLVSADVTIQSGPARVNLLELFTSEGCSSCPPAEVWFSTLTSSPRLWRDVVPVGFHVDYWDSLGWKDRFGTPAASDRQRSYAAAWGSESVYTPGFVLNGREWRDRDLESIPASSADVGRLSATMQENGNVRVKFAPSQPSSRTWTAYVALLGFGETSDVTAGENSGRRLVHDFVVLNLVSSEMSGAVPEASLRLPGGKQAFANHALAVWVVESGSTEPVQAVGGFLGRS